MTVAPHTEWFTIYTFQEDENGTARVQTLCDYMQEAAGNHAAGLGVSIDRLLEDGVAWVLARMRVVLEGLPSVHERIQVETWPVGVEGLQFRRDFIVRREDGFVLARAVSHWVVVSLETRKVGRMPPFIAAVALDNAATALQDARSKLPEAGPEHETCAFRARLADVDRNRHVNNVRCVEWILESVPEAVRSGMRLSDLEVMFRAESFWKDAVSARTMPREGQGEAERGFIHSLVRKADGRELVRARTFWRAP
ncbi:MAG: acyl-ACP thioesterase [Deltaproteobacteria bacterium]|nr:acyl-ACP thioesterase [Deltaproteobacteria bacterium]